MFKLIKKYLLILIVALITAAPAAAASNKWETLKTERADAKTVVKETELEIKTASSTIIVTSNHNVQIKIFTILGRLLNSETLPPGTNQLTLPAHGVYIVKIGNITCKVAV
ncbi:MAG: T9SS type A sorting domain-containing protein [Bacteroidales bacterium]|nr:T9SS type A sorting domain-containing protein [Bacteroidales bacterium]MBD5287877.1 T9SS type A sorting domain-containing protein [Bacteroides sp.]MBD5386825.1 T9SS type A sorting domain-containing protein [bacterium]MDE6258517.1 T9SS type A sorting domain-containing protein [Muribaculaceae bacterium]